MKKISLKEFISTGVIGGIYIGMKDSEILPLIGKPDLVGGNSRKHRVPNIWKYGDFEFIFERKEQKLVHIVANFWKNGCEPSLGNSIYLDSFGIKGGMRAEDFINLLYSKNIAFKDLPSPTNETKEFLVNDVTHFIFNIDEKEFDDWIGLVKIICSCRTT